MPPARSNRAEILDDVTSCVSAGELNGNLRDIQRANRLFGGTRIMVRALSRVAGDAKPCTIIDLATGSADIPAAFIAQAERECWDVRVIATDLQPQVIAVAQARELRGKLYVQQADALDLPYDDDSFDIATLALALHHFDADEAIRVLTEMRRVARHYLIVSDLARSWPGYAGAWLVGKLLTRNRLTRNDAPLSALRAYTPAEALEMAVAAGWSSAKVSTVRPFRFILVGRP